jgi:hypothetical protein
MNYETNFFSDQSFRTNDEENARVGDCVEAVQQSQVRLIFVRRLVHGLRHWTNFHLPLLASPGKATLSSYDKIQYKTKFLKDYGGSPTLFGVASVINHISEIFAYFFSFRLIRQMGHVKVRTKNTNFIFIKMSLIEGAMRWFGWKCSPLPLHLLAEEPVVGPSF